MRKAIIRFVCLDIFLFFAFSLLAIDVPLTYEKFPDNPHTFQPMGMGNLIKTLKPPSGNWVFPEFICAQPIYAMTKLGDEERLLVLDRQKQKDKLYNRIYFDANANKDLTDDAVIDGVIESVPGRQYDQVRFPAVDTRIKIQGVTLPYSFRPDFLGRLRAIDQGQIDEDFLNRTVYLFLRSNCLLRGKFEMDGQTYTIRLSDANGNGLFDDSFELRKFKGKMPERMPIYAQGDGIFISDDEKIEADDQQVVGDWLLIRDNLFDLRINQAEKKISLSPVKENLVTLELSMTTEHISLYTENGEHFLAAFRPDKKIKIPKGKYRIYNYKAMKKDEQGDLWSLGARGTTESPWMTLNGVGDSKLAFGEPLIASAEIPENRLVNIQGAGPGKKPVYLLFTIRGQSDEDITDISHIRGDRTKIPLSEAEGLAHRPKEPTYTVITADGKKVAKGSFEYG